MGPRSASALARCSCQAFDELRQPYIALCSLHRMLGLVYYWTKNATTRKRSQNGGFGNLFSQMQWCTESCLSLQYDSPAHATRRTIKGDAQIVSHSTYDSPTSGTGA